MMEYYNLVERKDLSGDSEESEALEEDEYLWPPEVRQEIIQPSPANDSETVSMLPENHDDEDPKRIPMITPRADDHHEPLPSETTTTTTTTEVAETSTPVPADPSFSTHASDQEPAYSPSSTTTLPHPSVAELSLEEGQETWQDIHEWQTESGEPDSTSEVQRNDGIYSEATSSVADTVQPTTTISAQPSITESESTSVSASAPSSQQQQQSGDSAGEATGSPTLVGPLPKASSTATEDPNTNRGVSVPKQQSSHTNKDGNTQESIYKTIMKRLNALELNATLSQRYLDEQNKMLNDVFMNMEKRHQDQLILLIGRLNDTATSRIDSMASFLHKDIPKNYFQLILSWVETTLRATV